MLKFLSNLISAQRKPSKRGFTLLELIVVIVVLGILAAIAIPTFAGVITRANDASAATTLQAVITDAKSLYAINQGSTPADWYTSFATAASEVPAAASVIASSPAFTVNVDVPSGDATASSTYLDAITAAGISGATTGASLSKTQLSIGDDVGNHVFGLANLSSSGNCVFATLDTAPGGVSEAWSMGTGIGSNCSASVAVLGKAADLSNVSTLKSSGGSGGGSSSPAITGFTATALPHGDIGVSWDSSSNFMGIMPTVHYAPDGLGSITDSPSNNGFPTILGSKTYAVIPFSPTSIGYADTTVPIGSTVDVQLVNGSVTSPVVQVVTSDTGTVDSSVTATPVISVARSAGGADATWVDLSVATPTPGAAYYIYYWNYTGSCDYGYAEGCTQKQFAGVSSVGGTPGVGDTWTMYLSRIQAYTSADASYDLTAVPVMANGEAGPESSPVSYLSPYLP